MPEKTALVLSAGGMFGAYQAGAWRELSTRFQPDIVVGTSVGALNGWAIAGGCPPDELIRCWSDQSSGAFLALASPSPAVARVSSMTPVSPVAFRSSFPLLRRGFRSAWSLTDALRLRPRLVRSEEITWQHLAAACAIPLGLPPVRIDGRWYTDGGVLDVAAALGGGRNGRDARHRR